MTLQGELNDYITFLVVKQETNDSLGLFTVSMSTRWIQSQSQTYAKFQASPRQNTFQIDPTSTPEQLKRCSSNFDQPTLFTLHS